MNKWKVAFFVVLILGLATNGILLYGLIGSAVSYGYLYDSYTEETTRFDTLGDLVIAGADKYSQADILNLLREANEDALIFEEGNAILYEGVKLVFESDRLTAVE